MTMNNQSELLSAVEDGRALVWEPADSVVIDEYDGADWLVKTNGDEWRDVSLRVMRSWQLRHELRPEVVRGRPIWVARIKTPK